MALTRVPQEDYKKKKVVKEKIVKIPTWCRWVDCSKEGYIRFSSEVE